MDSQPGPVETVIHAAPAGILNECESSTYEQQPGGYRAFVPKRLPLADLRLGADLQVLVSAADQALGRLDGVVSVVPDPDMFVLQYVRREAVLSSQIEGTHASLMDVLEYEARLATAEAHVDAREVVNYVAAMTHGLEGLQRLPVARRLLCEVHAVLMHGVRGGEPARTPGGFRRSQNWIGGASPATARFVPPPHTLVDDLFANLERFLHDRDPIPPLVRIGIAHAQFETIHPFLDGNGRVGRLLITLWLVEQGILRKPLLYPSLHFKTHRQEYVERLQAVRDDGAWEEWLAFFLEGIAHVAAEAAATAARIVELRERDRARIVGSMARKAPNALLLLDEMFRRPVTTAKAVERALAVSQPTASSLVAELTKAGILQELTGRRRNRVFAYREYLHLFPDASSRE